MEEKKITVEIIDNTKESGWTKFKRKVKEAKDKASDFLWENGDTIAAITLGAGVAIDAFIIGATIGIDKGAKAGAESKLIKGRDIYTQNGEDGETHMYLVEQTADGSLYKTDLASHDRDIRNALSIMDGKKETEE